MLHILHETNQILYEIMILIKTFAMPMVLTNINDKIQTYKEKKLK